MKTKIICILLSLVLSIAITGCSSIKNNLNSNNSGGTGKSKISDTTVPKSLSSTSSDSKSDNTQTQVTSENNKNSAALEAYKAVLQNKTKFFSTDNKKNLYLNDFLTNKELYGTTFNLTHFTVLDMDGDKVPEVVLELSVDNSPFGFEILHYMNDTVYGYYIVYRGLESLKMDGTFLYSNGAADIGYGKLKFKSDAYETDVLGYSKSSQNNDGMTIAYFINNKPVTKESFDSFMKDQKSKKDVVWYEFSQKNIEAELSNN